MQNKERIAYGVAITVAVFVISTLVGSKLQINVDFIPHSFVQHTLMLVLSIGLIYGLRKIVDYKIALPQFKKTIKPILYGLLATIAVNISMAAITKLPSGKVEVHGALNAMSPLQVFVFIFIFASIAEELLFRGFLMNMLKPITTKGLVIFKRNISIPVIISAVAFGLGHLILITTGAGWLFLLRVVVFTTVLGLIAGYYQEKYDNNAYAIIVHMSGNLMSVIGALLMN